MASGSDKTVLIRVSARLGRRSHRRHGTRRVKGLAALWLVTDPDRTHDPIQAAGALPAGAGVIYRAFGGTDAVAVGQALRRVTRRRGLTFLVGADAALARRVGADGVHLPQRLAHLAPRLRAAHPRWRITAAAHEAPAIRRARGWGVDAVLVSPVFPSRSPSAKAWLGPVRFEFLARGARIPIIALGGVNGRTAPRLANASCAGLAAVDAFNP